MTPTEKEVSLVVTRRGSSPAALQLQPMLHHATNASPALPLSMRLGLTWGTRSVLPPISLRVANFQTHLDLQCREDLVERREARLVDLTRETDLLESRAVALDGRQQRIEDVEAALVERERQAGENEHRLQAWEQYLTAQAQLLDTGHQDSQRMQLEIVQCRRKLDERETVVSKREEACDDASRDCLNTHGENKS